MPLVEFSPAIRCRIKHTYFTALRSCGVFCRKSFLASQPGGLLYLTAEAARGGKLPERLARIFPGGTSLLGLLAAMVEQPAGTADTVCFKCR